MSNVGHIFNVEEVTGKEHSAFETTVAEARIEAPNALTAHQIEKNAEEAHEAAEHAASVAKTMGSKYTGEPTTAAEQFRGDASRTTDAAVAEGKKDVDQAKAAGAGYVEQVKSFTNNTIETAQGYLPTAIGGKPDDMPDLSIQSKFDNQKAGTGVVESVRTTAANAYSAAKEAAQPHIEKIQGVTQEYLGTAGIQGTQVKSTAAEPMPASSTGIPAASAPLESGPHTVSTPYPSEATKVSGADIAASGAPPGTNRN